MSEKIRCAIIGTSSIARSHIKALQDHPHLDLVGIHSRNKERCDKFAQQFNLQALPSVDAIFNDDSITAVDIVTEPARHGQLALSAIASNKHVLIEKPIDIDLTVAERIVQAADKSSKVISVISQKRFDPRLIQMKEQLNSGVIGQPYFANIKTFYHRDENYYKNENSWRDHDSNVLINQAIHWLDIIIWFFGYPEKVQTYTCHVNPKLKNFDTAVVSMKFANEFICTLACSVASHRNLTEDIIIHGSKGIISKHGLDNIIGDNEPTIVSKLLKIITTMKENKRKPLIHLQVHDFIEAIIHNKEAKVSVADAYAALKLVKMCVSE